MMKTIGGILVLTLFLLGCDDDTVYDRASDYLYVSHERMMMSNFDDSLSFVIQNNASWPQDIELSYDSRLWHLSESEITLPEFEKRTLQVKMVGPLNGVDSYQDDICFVNGTDTLRKLTITYENYQYQMDYFEFNYLDCEVAKEAHKIVFVSSFPSYRLITYDLEDEVWDEVVLDECPYDFSVSPQGDIVALAYNKSIKIYSVGDGTLLHDFAVDDKIGQVVLSSKGWCYALVNSEDVHYSIDIDNNKVYLDDAPRFVSYSTSILKLHPEENYLYAVWEWWSSSNITMKFDISSGRISGVTDVAYEDHLNHRFWFEDQNIIGKAGNVYSTSAGAAVEMNEIGVLPEISTVLDCTFDGVNNQFYVVNSYLEHWADDDSQYELLQYDASSFALMKRIAISNYSYQTLEGRIDSVQANVNRVLLHPDYDKIYVVSSNYGGDGVPAVKCLETIEL